MAGYEIKLEYFSKSGKFKYEGSYFTTSWNMFEVFDEVRAMCTENDLPGLNSGSWDGYIYVNTDEHPNGYPALITPTGETK